MKKVLFVFLLSLFVVLSTSAQQARRTFATTVIGADQWVKEIGTGIQYHQLVWNLSGTAATCQVELDYSADGITSSGQIITTQLCTSTGSSAVSSTITANYVRINVTTKSGTGSISVTYLGFTSNPVGAATPGGVNPQLQFNNAGSFGGVAGSAVTAATGAIALTAGADTTTLFNLTAHSSTQSAPLIKASGDGTDYCTMTSSVVCIGTGNFGSLELVGTNAGGNDGPVLTLTNQSGGNGELILEPFSLEITGGGSDGNAAYLTMGDDFAPQSSNVSVYSENWTYFGSNGNTSWYAAIGDSGHAGTGQIRAGWIPDKSGQVARTGFFSAVDAVGANEVDIQELGTIGTNWNFNLPANAGTAGQFLTSQGGTTASMTWTSGISSSGVLCSGTFTTVNGLVTACTAVSDSRLKTNIKPFSAGLAEILKLHPSLYHMNPAGQKITGQAAAFEQAGFIAQDVQKAIPEAIGKETHDGVDYLTVADRPILAALVNAVKEQQQEIAELKKQLAALKLTEGTR